MTARLTLLAVIATLTACAGPATTPSRRYVGTATPRTLGPLCPSSKAEAQVRDGTIVLTPDEGTWTLEGQLTANGTVYADKTTQASNKQPWSTTFEGQWTPKTIIGTYKTPRCTFAIDLKSG